MRISSSLWFFFSQLIAAIKAVERALIAIVTAFGEVLAKAGTTIEQFLAKAVWLLGQLLLGLAAIAVVLVVIAVGFGIWQTHEQAAQQKVQDEARKVEEARTAQRTAEFNLQYARLSQAERTRMLTRNQYDDVRYACGNDTGCFIGLRDSINRHAFVHPMSEHELRDVRPDLFAGYRDPECYVRETTYRCTLRLDEDRD